MNGAELPILEMGLAISDVFGTDGIPIDEFNWMDKAEIWTTVTEQYANNNSFTNILVHPNRSYKVDALEYLLDHMSKDIYPMELTQYGEFWKEKNTIKFASYIEDNKMKIFTDEVGLGNDQFSFVVDFPNGIDAIEIYNNEGELQDFYQREYYLGTGLMYQKSFQDIPLKSVSFDGVDQVLYQNYPNPFSYYTTIEYHVPEDAYVSLQVFDLYGRVIGDLVNEKQKAGIYNLEFSAKNHGKGIYFYRIHIQAGDKYSFATKKMIIK